MKLFSNLILNDFKKNKAVTTVLILFFFLSVLFMAGGLRVTGTMISSMKGLNEAAIPPDYMRMHKGEYNESKVLEFVKEHDYIEAFQVVKMLNIKNSSIYYQGVSFEKCLMDNGFIVQNEAFDYLLDDAQNIARINPGEIGVPVYYSLELGIEQGDEILLKEGDQEIHLVVKTIIRDASMNAPLASSKRFLINQADMDKLSRHMGEWEYCFSFLLNEGTSTGMLEKDYLDAKMPSNGVGVTLQLLNLLNAFSYGMIAFMILAISTFIIVIAMLCLSYIIGATMAEENQSLGQMKAIGFEGKAIEDLFFMKYLVIMLFSVVLGYFLAIPFEEKFSMAVVSYCGKGTEPWLKWLLSFVGMLVLILIVITKCRSIIRRNLKGTVLQLLKGDEQIKKEGHYTLPEKGFRFLNFSLAGKDLLVRWKEYRIVFLVFIVSTFLILLPMNISNTILDPSFITYMGVGECQIRIDLQYSEDIEQQRQILLNHLRKDDEISKYAVFQNGYVQCLNAENEWEYLRVVSGDETVFPLNYLNGQAPKKEGEIALSSLNAKELGKKTGDQIVIQYGIKKSAFMVSGIYQDITYGGKTAKADVDFLEQDTEATIIYLNVKPGVAIATKVGELRRILEDGKVTPIKEFITQTLGGVAENMKMVQYASQIIALLLGILITCLFLQLIIAREHSAIAIKKAIGFTNRDIRVQFGIRIFILLLAAIITGTVLANVLGETIFGVFMSGMGISKIEISLDPIMAFLVCPLLQMITVVLAIVPGTRIIKKYHIRNQIME